jgi:hypothetical protein
MGQTVEKRTVVAGVAVVGLSRIVRRCPVSG